MADYGSNQTSSIAAEFKFLSDLQMQQLACSSFAAGSAPLHLHKNRYGDCLPLEPSRVKLNPKYSQDGTDYINANWVSGTDDGATYIATQAPLPWTFGDFWSMLFTEGCQLVVCLTKLVEQGILKAHQYWPENVGDVQAYGFVDVEFKKCMELKHITIRNFELRSRTDGTTKEIVQLHYTEWPDYGVPDVTSFVRLIELMKVYMVGEKPLVAVHCSAGVGRTGVLLSCLSLHQNPATSVPFLVLKLRHSRPLFVQSPAQYQFIHMYKNYLERVRLHEASVASGQKRHVKRGARSLSSCKLSVSSPHVRATITAGSGDLPVTSTPSSPSLGRAKLASSSLTFRL